MRAIHNTAILIASKDGEATIGYTVAGAAHQADVYVVSDGSSDGTARTARAAGARVLERAESGGKPNALRAANKAFALTTRYRYVCVLDDDTTIADDYVARVVERMDRDKKIAAASGRIDSLWDSAHRWNPYIAMRAFMYWSYQVSIKRGQNALRVVNVICGANTVFRSDVFAQVIEDDVPYAVDDMFWVAEIVRLRLGRIAYVHQARSWTIDPHTFKDWYRQTVRWSWAQFQSVRGHHLLQPLVRSPERKSGWRVSGFNIAYLALIIDWFPYAIEPLLIVPLILFVSSFVDPFWIAVYFVGTTGAWIGIGAIALRKPQLVVLAPILLLLDLVYRVTMIHAVVKAITQPRVERCRWTSPPRFALTPSQPPTNTRARS